MHSQIPGRLSFLYSSAILVGVSALFLYCFFIWDTQIAEKDFDAATTIMPFLLVTPFVGSSVFLILFLRRNYPSTPINQIQRIFYFIAVIASIVLEILFFYYFLLTIDISEFVDRLNGMINQPINLLKLVSLFVIMGLQFWNNIEGFRLLKIIRRNSRTEYNESF